MRPINDLPDDSGQPPVPLMLSIVWCLVLIITCGTATTCLAVSFSLGDELVSIGQNFTGGSRSTSQFFFPPDSMGAVGPTSFVELLNGRYAVYDKGSGAVVQTSSLDQFWRNAGTVPTNFSFDPRVVYDPFSDRYLAASTNNPTQPNDFLLAVSKTSDPIQGWTGFAIKSDVTQQRWADFPTLGFNRDGVYLSANMFPIQGGQATHITTTIVAVPKMDLIASTPTVTHATIFPNNSSAQRDSACSQLSI